MEAHSVSASERYIKDPLESSACMACCSIAWSRWSIFVGEVHWKNPRRMYDDGKFYNKYYKETSRVSRTKHEYEI